MAAAFVFFLTRILTKRRLVTCRHVTARCRTSVLVWCVCGSIRLQNPKHVYIWRIRRISSLPVRGWRGSFVLATDVWTSRLLDGIQVDRKPTIRISRFLFANLIFMEMNVIGQSVSCDIKMTFLFSCKYRWVVLSSGFIIRSIRRIWCRLAQPISKCYSGSGLMNIHELLPPAEQQKKHFFLFRFGLKPVFIMWSSQKV